jgi:predicted PhzF superfamily epimerase YddE/YHI9
MASGIRKEKNRREIALFQVDAFTDKIFSGNPAGVMPA